MTRFLRLYSPQLTPFTVGYGAAAGPSTKGATTRTDFAGAEHPFGVVHQFPSPDRRRRDAEGPEETRPTSSTREQAAAKGTKGEPLRPRFTPRFTA
jgi:hypothetical protein